MYSNAEKLAAVVSYWARPAISQVAGAKMMQLPVMQSAQAALMSSGIVGSGYSLAANNTVAKQPCQSCSRTSVCDMPVTITLGHFGVSTFCSQGI